jgi:hypothetical protein
VRGDALEVAAPRLSDPDVHPDDRAVGPPSREGAAEVTGAFDQPPSGDRVQGGHGVQTLHRWGLHNAGGGRYRSNSASARNSIGRIAFAAQML